MDTKGQEGITKGEKATDREGETINRLTAAVRRHKKFITVVSTLERLVFIVKLH